MKHIVSMPGVKFSSPLALPAVSRTPEGEAMGGVPGWRVFIDPAYVENGNPRNRAMPATILEAGGAFGVITTVAGQPFITRSSGKINANTQINNDAWTMFGVFNDINGGAVYPMQFNDAVADGADVLPRLGFNSAGDTAFVLRGTTSYRAGYTPSVDFTDRTSLVMWTFSSREGLRIFVNGVEGEHEADETEVFTGRYGAGEWDMMIGGAFNFGMCGLLDIDLGWSEHEGYRTRIETYLMNKYSISG